MKLTFTVLTNHNHNHHLHRLRMQAQYGMIFFVRDQYQAIHIYLR